MCGYRCQGVTYLDEDARHQGKLSDRQVAGDGVCYSRQRCREFECIYIYHLTKGYVLNIVCVKMLIYPSGGGIM